MYQIDKTPFGFKIVFQGFIQKSELKRWAKEAKEMLDSQKRGFGVLLDMRGMAPLPVEAGDFMRQNQTAAKSKGMGRSAQVLDDPITTNVVEWEAVSGGETMPPSLMVHHTLPAIADKARHSVNARSRGYIRIGTDRGTKGRPAGDVPDVGNLGRDPGRKVE